MRLDWESAWRGKRAIVMSNVKATALARSQLVRVSPGRNESGLRWRGIWRERWGVEPPPFSILFLSMSGGFHYGLTPGRRVFISVRRGGKAKKFSDFSFRLFPASPSGFLSSFWPSDSFSHFFSHFFLFFIFSIASVFS